jgi:hypothetical protein
MHIHVCSEFEGTLKGTYRFRTGHWLHERIRLKVTLLLRSEHQQEKKFLKYPKCVIPHLCEVLDAKTAGEAWQGFALRRIFSSNI